MGGGRRGRDPIPESFRSVEEAAEFWDTHSTADYEDLMRDVHFDVNITRRTFVASVEGRAYRDDSGQPASGHTSSFGR